MRAPGVGYAASGLSIAPESNSNTNQVIHMSIDQHADPLATTRSDTASNALPDIASDQATTSAAGLDWVGMDAIDLPIRIIEGETDLRVPARVSAEVDLHNAARGIHMSRLYLALDAAVADSCTQPARDGNWEDGLAPRKASGRPSWPEHRSRPLRGPPGSARSTRPREIFARRL